MRALTAPGAGTVAAAGEALAIRRRLVLVEGWAHLLQDWHDAEALVARLSRRGGWLW